MVHKSYIAVKSINYYSFITVLLQDDKQERFLEYDSKKSGTM